MLEESVFGERNEQNEQNEQYDRNEPTLFNEWNERLVLTT